MRALIGRQKILIVDDERSVSETLALIFSARGYEARIAYSAEEAIEIVATWKPDLAILDVVLPGMNGIDFGIILRANYPNCQVLLLSGQSATAEYLEQAARAGHEFRALPKPTHPVAMLETVADLLTSAHGVPDN